MEKVKVIWWMRSLSGIWDGESESYMVGEVTIRDFGMEKVKVIWWMRSLSGIWDGESESYMVDEVTIRDLGWRR